VHPDVCLDARAMEELPESTYDAVYCSHNLEHFYAHEVPTILSGFRHVLKPSGTVEVIVPNLTECMRAMLTNNLDIMDVWYRAGTAAVTFHDVLYGWNHAMSQGNLYYAHKCGFTALSLYQALERAQFTDIHIAVSGGNLTAEAQCP
jgi:ubiquinone/menaquinone biosynthesis C-methylase UbiE